MSIKDTNSFDLIISIDLLEHVSDDISVLYNFYRALHPDGKLLLHLPRRYQERKLFLSSFRNPKGHYGHVRDEYTLNEIFSKLSQTKFHVDQISYGYSRWGELARETNSLFASSFALRTLTALIFHPLSILFAYRDICKEHDDGNSFLILSHPVKRNRVLL